MSAFGELHRPGDPLLLPTAWDAASGAALAAAGFHALGTTSLGVAAAAGKRDATGAAWVETRALAHTLVSLTAFVSVDLERGFAERPEEIGDRAVELAERGVAGVNLEDGLGDPSRHARVICEVKRRAPALFVNARTDTHWLRHGDVDAAVARCQAYAAAGADGVFVPGVAGERDIAELVDGVGLPLNVLFAPGSPSLPRLAELGVARVSTGSVLFRVSLQAAVRAATSVRAGGRLDGVELPSYAEVDGLAPGRWGPT